MIDASLCLVPVSYGRAAIPPGGAAGEPRAFPLHPGGRRETAELRDLQQGPRACIGNGVDDVYAIHLHKSGHRLDGRPFCRPQRDFACSIGELIDWPIERICSLKRIGISALVRSSFPFLARRELARARGTCCVLGLLVKRVTDLARVVVVRQALFDFLSEIERLGSGMDHWPTECGRGYERSSASHEGAAIDGGHSLGISRQRVHRRELSASHDALSAGCAL